MGRLLSDSLSLPKQQPSSQTSLFVELRLWLDFLPWSDLAREQDKPIKEGVGGGRKYVSDKGSLSSTVMDVWAMVGKALERQDLRTKTPSSLLLVLDFLPFSTGKWGCVFGKSQFS